MCRKVFSTPENHTELGNNYAVLHIIKLKLVGMISGDTKNKETQQLSSLQAEPEDTKPDLITAVYPRDLLRNSLFHLILFEHSKKAQKTLRFRPFMASTYLPFIAKLAQLTFDNTQRTGTTHVLNGLFSHNPIKLSFVIFSVLQTKMNLVS
jgi:hypothetical protein